MYKVWQLGYYDEHIWYKQLLLSTVASLSSSIVYLQAFNTFIDDVFAFIITMPTSHRLACFRDDVVFLIYLYQRWYATTHAEIVPELNQNKCFLSPNPPCSLPPQALPSGQNKSQWIWSLLWRQAQRQEAQGLKGTDRPSPSVVQCHASIKTHLVPTVKQSRGTWRNIFISGPVRSASSWLHTFAVEQLPASWRVASWLCVCTTLQKQKCCDNLDCYLL